MRLVLDPVVMLPKLILSGVAFMKDVKLVKSSIMLSCKRTNFSLSIMSPVVREVLKFSARYDFVMAMEGIFVFKPLPDDEINPSML